MMNQNRSVPDIRLFVCCHQPSHVPEHPLLNPIQVGAALANTRFSSFLHDDTGENISLKNRSYCELTAQYWAWKNTDADYYGFFHYRRYLYPDIGAKRPYRIESEPTLSLLDKLGYGDFGNLIQQYDLILPKGENMYVSVREHYAAAPFHHGKDLELVEKIVQERHPEMAEAMEKYLSGSACYFGNIFIMRRRVFHDYCAWLFSILEEFERRADTTGYSFQEYRVDGYVAERLLGVYAGWLEGRTLTLELPRVHFCPGFDYFRRSLLNMALPPGSKRRSLAKQNWRRLNII